MPELPEVETVINGLKPVMLNKKIARIEATRKNLRYDFPENLDAISKNSKIIDMQRLSKYIVIRLDTGYSLISHLGMSGKYTIFSYARNEKIEQVKHDHIIFHMDNGDTIIYNDPRRFGFLISCKTTEEKNEKHLSKLGIDPTDDKLTDKYIYDKFQKCKSNLKTALMNQSIISGLGNIYVCEAMYRAKLNPNTVASTIPHKTIKILTKHIKEIITEAIKAGGSTLKDYKNAEGAMGYFQHNFDVYGRNGENCNKCKSEIDKIIQGGRSTFYCPKSQENK